MKKIKEADVPINVDSTINTGADEENQRKNLLNTYTQDVFNEKTSENELVQSAKLNYTDDGALLIITYEPTETAKLKSPSWANGAQDIYNDYFTERFNQTGSIQNKAWVAKLVADSPNEATIKIKWLEDIGESVKMKNIYIVNKHFNSSSLPEGVKVLESARNDKNLIISLNRALTEDEIKSLNCSLLENVYNEKVQLLKESSDDSVSVNKLKELDEILNAWISGAEERGLGNIKLSYNMPHVDCISIPGAGYLELTSDVLYDTDYMFDQLEEADESNLVGKKFKCTKGMNHPNMGKMFKKGQTYKVTEDKGEEITLGGWNIYKKFLNTNFEPITESINEAEVPASQLDFKHQQLSKVQADIETIAELKAEDTSNDLYTNLLDAYDKVVEILSDAIAEDPVGTVIDNDEVGLEISDETEAEAPVEEPATEEIVDIETTPEETSEEPEEI